MASQNPTDIFGKCKLEASTPVAFGFNVSLKHPTSSQLTLTLLAVGLIVSAVVTVHLQLILVENLLLRLLSDFLSRRQRRAICLG